VQLVLATTNKGKIDEIRTLLPQFDFIARPRDVGDIEETEDSFAGNARLKAKALVDATGVAALAEDSGLEVDALGGNPGVRSARFAGENATDQQNIDKLLIDLRDVDDAARTARFRTVAIVVYPDGSEIVAEGAIEGRILREPRGTNGFGYDPVFAPQQFPDRTFAELTAPEKNAISHRGQALRKLQQLIGSEG
jgi:XTP/dITP diphosphohydrolase